ncbi:MAG: iron-containing alcohol dehydrogenase [Blautia sp.]|nr:iron-containing alcohol dehydrogenase [Blautia sp.]
MEFNYFLPVNLIFGRGRTEQLGALAAGFGRRALVVTGSGSTKRSGLLSRVQEYLERAGVEAVIYDEVPQNPLTTTAEKGVDMARKNACDVVIGVGGGSVMDCAKAVAFLAVNPGDVTDYIFSRRTGSGCMPLILIPTTCGTGSEGNGFAVLTNPETGDKKSLRSDWIVPRASIVDSELMETMPKHILSSVGFDALCHAMEAYLSKRAQPMTDAVCEYAMRLIGKNLIPLYNGENSPGTWDAITLASTLGGMVIHTAGTVLPHGMEHPASGLKNIVHGRGLAALVPAITEASVDAACARYSTISQCIGGQSEKDCAAALRRFLNAIRLTVTLGELGITEEDIPWLTDNCLKISGASIANHPKEFDAAGIAELYRRAL